MTNYLNDLLKAFNSVDTDFFFTEALKDPSIILEGANNRQTFIQLTERQFSAELYHLWRQIIISSNEDYSNLKIGFEVSKKFIDNEFVKSKSSFRPDLVLHQSQIHFHPDFQKIYVEIKTNPSLNLKRIKYDLNKTLFAMCQYGFQNGVFISVNSDLIRLKKLIVNYINHTEKKHNNVQEFWSRFYLLHSDEKGDRHHETFKEIKTAHTQQRLT